MPAAKRHQIGNPEAFACQVHTLVRSQFAPDTIARGFGAKRTNRVNRKAQQQQPAQEQQAAQRDPRGLLRDANEVRTDETTEIADRVDGGDRDSGGGAAQEQAGQRPERRLEGIEAGECNGDQQQRAGTGLRVSPVAARATAAANKGNAECSCRSPVRSE